MYLTFEEYRARQEDPFALQWLGDDQPYRFFLLLLLLSNTRG